MNDPRGRISELIDKLEEVREAHGDLRVDVEVAFIGGDYGEHNLVERAPLDDVDVVGDKVIIKGF